MNLVEYASLAEAIAVLIAVAFGVVQVRQIRRQRRRDAAQALMGSLQTRDMLEALLLLDGLPEGLSKSELEKRVGKEVVLIQSLLGTWESLGILVFRDEVSLDLVDDFFSGSVIHSWEKLRDFVEDLRAETDRQTRWEWFQWLAERMLERETASPPVPAFLEHRNWRKRKD